jgi:hypothetical protein
MRLSDALVAKFQQIYLEVFGEAISVEVAEAELLSLSELVQITQRPGKTTIKEK